MTHFVKSPLNFLMESLGSFTCDLIDGVGVTKVISPAAGAVEGGVNAGSVESLGVGKSGRVTTRFSRSGCWRCSSGMCMN